MTLIKNVLNIGTQQQTFASANRTRTLNFVSIFTTLISALYTLNYIFAINNTYVAFINSLFTFSYLIPLYFCNKKAYKSAKVWLFSVLMLHLFVCTNLYVTNASGFHLYYFLVPTGAFLLFELDEKFEKISLSVISVLLFFYCENTLNPHPLISLSDAMNHIIYQSVIFINMVEAIIVLTIFANQIEINEKLLIRQATTDSLTNIANRRYFFEQGQKLLSLTHSNHSSFVICLIDFDYFKKINDDFGHNIGDLCLVEISKLIKSFCHSQDLFARIGGEEFAIIMPNTSINDAKSHADIIRQAIAKHVISINEEQTLSCTVSVGLAQKNAHSDELKDILICADNALYIAKKEGRNQIQVHKT